MLKLPLLLIAALLLTSLCKPHAAEPITNSLGMKLVPIAPGSFVMGQDGPTSDYFFTKHPEETNVADFDERPAHQVTISQAFHLGATEVTEFCAWLSDDEGKTWQGGLMLDERDGVSYPDGFQSPDGTIYISYDHNRSTDGEILMARITEEDILAKKLVGPKSKLKMLISRPLKPKASATSPSAQ